MTPERKALLRALIMAADEHGNTIARTSRSGVLYAPFSTPQ